MKTNPVFQNPQHEKAWLLTVAANLSKNRIKYHRLRETDELKEELAAEQREDLSFVWEAVKSLPQTQRVLLTGLWLMPGLLQKNQTEEPENVSIANGIVEKDSLEQLSEAVGFPVADVTGLPFTPEKITYWSYWDDLAQVEYEGEGQSAMFRQSEGTEDNSGDYNEYTCEKELQAGEMKVTLKGETEQYTLAIWTDGESSYSMEIEAGLSEETWAALIEGIH